jgi:hypothetical protein
MIRSTRLVTAACVLVLAGAGLAGADSGEDQLIKYYRKKNNVPPTAKVAAEGVKDSTNIKGAKEGTLVVGEGAAAQRRTFVASSDLKWVVFGDIVDTSVDPAKAVMAKIAVKDRRTPRSSSSSTRTSSARSASAATTPSSSRC